MNFQPGKLYRTRASAFLYAVHDEFGLRNFIGLKRGNVALCVDIIANTSNDAPLIPLVMLLTRQGICYVFAWSSGSPEPWEEL